MEPGPGGHGVTRANNTNIVEAVVRRALWRASLHEDDRQAGFGDHVAERFDRRAGRVLLQHDHAAWLEKCGHGGKELPVNSPIRIVPTDITDIVVGEMRWVGHDEVPAFGRRYAFEVVGQVDRHAVGKPIRGNGPAAGFDSLRIDIGETERLAKLVRQHRKTDKTRSRAPFEQPCLRRHAAALEERDKAWSEMSSASVEVRSEEHTS